MTTFSEASTHFFFLIGLLLGPQLILASAVGAASIEGVWASHSAACKDIFSKSDRGGIAFKKNSDAFGTGLVIDGDRIREKVLSCRIVRRNQEGGAIHLLASCSSDVMLDTIRFSLRIVDDNQIIRSFPGIPELDFPYERCRL